MEEVDSCRELSIAVVYIDELLMQLEAIARAGAWSGSASAYTVQAEIANFADALLRFVDGGPSTSFEAGADTGIGLIGLRFYRTDRSGHIACHARLASVTPTHRREGVSQLAVEFVTEAWAVIKFARQLEELAYIQAGRAKLAIES